MSMNPFSLILSRHPPGPTMTTLLTPFPMDTTDLTPKQLKLKFLQRLHHMMSETAKTLTKAQARYKRYLDRAVQFLPQFYMRQEVFLDRPPDQTKMTGKLLAISAKSKVMTKSTGLYMVLSATAYTVTLDEDSIPNTVSTDRVTLAPPLQSSSSPVVSPTLDQTRSLEPFDGSDTNSRKHRCEDRQHVTDQCRVWISDVRQNRR